MKGTKERDYRPVVTFLAGILIIALVAFNVETWTGTSVRERSQVLTKIYVSSSPDIANEDHPVIEPGGRVFFTAEVGSYGARNIITLYDRSTHVKDRRVATIPLSINCGGDTCRPNRITTKNYRLNDEWTGEFCGRIRDLFEDKKVEVCFTISPP